MIVINLFGESNTGKSTHSAGIYSALKKQGIRVELAREYCKNFFYEDTRYKLDNQFLITGKQVEQIETFRYGKIDVVVTDSPILLGAIYKQVFNTSYSMSQAIREVHHSYDNYNILLECDVDFDSHGRGHSGVHRGEIRKLLLNEGLQFDRQYKTTELKSYTKIVSDIKRRLEC